MPKSRKAKSIFPIMEAQELTEETKILKNRSFRFKELLDGQIDDFEIDRLVYSDVDYWDLDKLLREGCDPETAIKILM